MEYDGNHSGRSESSSVESGHFNNVAQLLMVTAAVELGAGLALLVAPAAIIRLLFGATVELFPAVGIRTADRRCPAFTRRRLLVGAR